MNIKLPHTYTKLNRSKRSTSLILSLRKFGGPLKLHMHLKTIKSKGKKIQIQIKSVSFSRISKLATKYIIYAYINQGIFQIGLTLEFHRIFVLFGKKLEDYRPQLDCISLCFFGFILCGVLHSLL